MISEAPPGAIEEAIRSCRDVLEYDRLCNTNMQQLGTQCLPLDDGLQGVQEMEKVLSWRGSLANNSVYRLFRIEPVAVTLRLEVERTKTRHGRN